MFNCLSINNIFLSVVNILDKIEINFETYNDNNYNALGNAANRKIV